MLNQKESKAPNCRKSLVRVRFTSSGDEKAYFNNLFDLHRGDIVYVEGRYEGQPGHIVDINYNFKIKPFDYNRVIAVADTTVHGKFFVEGPYFMSFDREVIPKSKIRSWFIPPLFEEYEVGYDDSTFSLDDLRDMKVREEVALRGYNYFINNYVKYISIDGNDGYAIVRGETNYEVEFTFCDGKIGHLVCTCPYDLNCKHEYATMLLLKDMLERINKDYALEYERSSYFAAVAKDSMFAYVVNGREKGIFEL